MLVIGAANAGGQIAEDLHLAERRVPLASAARRGPRVYRDPDGTDWLGIRHALGRPALPRKSLADSDTAKFELLPLPLPRRRLRGSGAWPSRQRTDLGRTQTSGALVVPRRLRTLPEAESDRSARCAGRRRVELTVWRGRAN